MLLPLKALGASLSDRLLQGLSSPLGVAGLIGGILLSYAAAFLPQWLLPGTLLVAAALLLPKVPRRRLLSLCLLLGFGAGMACWYVPQPAEGYAAVSGFVADELSVEGTQVTTRLTAVTINGEKVQGDVWWSFFLPEESAVLPIGLTPGAYVTFEGRCYPPSGQENPAGFNFRDFLAGRGIHTCVTGVADLVCTQRTGNLKATLSALRHDLMTRLCRVMGDEVGQYASAMLLGTRSLLPDSETDTLSRLGLAHVLSVSGFHTAIFAGLLMQLFRPLGQGWRLTLTGSVLFLYALFTGWNPPVVRACLMLLCRRWFVLWQRQQPEYLERTYDSLRSVAMAAFLLLTLNPAQLFSASFQLSFGAVLGLLLVSPLVAGSSWLPRPGALAISNALERGEKKGRVLAALWLREGFAHSFGAQVGILLPSLYWFSELPLLSIPLNILLLPLLTLLLTAFWVMLPLSFVPLVNQVAGYLLGQVTTLLLSGLRYLSQQDGLVLWTGQPGLLTLLVGIGLLAVVFLPKDSMRRACFLLLLVLLPVSLIQPPHQGTEYRQFACGNADAAILQDEDVTLVMDTGYTGQELVDYLRAKRLSIDHLVLTHLHMDHAGGVAGLLAADIPIRRIWLP